MSLLTANNLSKVYAAEEIFSGIDVRIDHRARIALVGPNGAGKTTLVKLFTGEEFPETGEIHLANSASVGYLPQRPELAGTHSLWDEQLRAFDELRQMEADLLTLAEDMADDPDAIEQYGQMQEEFEARGGYSYEARIRMVLGGVGFSDEDYDTPLPQLSGGQKTRALLARLLLESPDLLILDEPTNHLDIFAVEWLEDFLKDYNGAVLAISHDRQFIDNYASEVWDLEFGRLENYRGNYTHYLQQRDERRERLQKEYEKQQEFIAKEKEYIRKHMGSRWTAQAKGRQKKLNTMKKRGDLLEHGALERRTIHLDIDTDIRSGDKVIMTHDLSIGYDDIPLLDIPDLTLWRGETAAIIGPNGAGKSTLLKTLTGELEPVDGQSDTGAKVQIGYFAQAHEGLNPEHSVLDAIMDASDLTVSESRDYLGQFLFSGDDVFRKVSTLSGGERGRLALAKLALQGANLLLLDEPTNHLDIDSQEILQSVIERFNGTVLLVSHDRYLIDALATHIWAITPERGFEAYHGTYKAYMRMRRERRQEEQAAASAHSNGAQKQGANFAEKVRGLTPYQLRQRVDELEDEIARLEAHLDDLTAAIASASEQGDTGKVQALGAEYAQAEADLESAMDEWADLADHLE
jgi:ATP-binding cassette subfamily F protein 3